MFSAVLSVLAKPGVDEVTNQANDYWSKVFHSQYFYPAIVAFGVAVGMIKIYRLIPDKLKWLIVGMIIMGLFGGPLLVLLGALGK